VDVAGARADELEMRLRGASYIEIMAAGGGIMNSVRATRKASVDELVTQTLPRLRRMLAHGMTTAEAKTGYGLIFDFGIGTIRQFPQCAAGFGSRVIP